MLRFWRPRALSLGSSLLALTILATSSAGAQTKKSAPKKKPAATAKPRGPAKKKPAPAPPPRPLPPAFPPPSAPTTPSPAPASPAPSPAPAPATPPPPVEPSPAELPTAEGEAKPADDGDRQRELERGEVDKNALEASGKDARPPLVDVGLGMKAFARHFKFADDVRNALPDYDLQAAPAVVLEAGVYPLRTKLVSAGIIGSFDLGLALGSTYRAPRGDQGGTRDTSALGYTAGARVNFHFGSSSVGVSGEYGAQNFTLDLPPPTATDSGVPDVAYRFIRPGLAGRIGIGSRFAVLVGGGYLHVLSAGEIISATYFAKSRSTVSGFDANLGVAYTLPFPAPMNHVELRPSVGFRRYAYTFKPDRAADPYDSTGATDDYYNAALVIGMQL